MVAGTLYTYPGNFRAAKALIAAKFSKADVKLVSDAADFAYGETNTSDAFRQKFLTSKVPAFESADGKVHLTDDNAIAYYLASDQLRGSSKEEIASIMQWTGYSDTEVLPAAVVLSLNALGSPDKSQLTLARAHLKDALTVLNLHLSKHKFMVGNHVTLADVSNACNLMFAFSNVIEDRQSYPNVAKWFETLKGMNEFKDVLEPMSTHLEGHVQKGKETTDKDKRDKGQKEVVKNAKEEKPKAEKPKKAKDEDEEEMDAADAALAAEPKQKDPFAELPPGTFNIDEWKRTYSNEDTNTVALPYFWDKFDKDNYSIWYCEYKYPQELTKVFMSCNLITGMFQRLDKMRKHSFGSLCLFGTDNNSTISGVWIWRGQDLAFKLSDDLQTDFESYTWQKLDPNDPKTKQMVNEYFAWEGNFDGKKFNQGKIWK